MNHILTRLKAGLYMATQSFSLLWYQKKLLLFFGIPAFITCVIRILFQNEFLKTLYFSLPFIIRIIISLLPSAIMTFFTVALMFHARLIMNGKHSTIRNSLTICLSKIKIILAWIIPSISVQLLITFLGAYEGPHHTFIVIIVGSFLIAWLLFTFFVLPLITFENESLMTNIKRSYVLTRTHLPEILGGEIWFVITFVLTALPLLLYGLATQKYAFDPIFNFFVIFITEIVINGCISTGHSIFKTMMYHEYVNKK